MEIYKLFSQRPPAWGWKSAMPRHVKNQDHWVYEGSRHSAWWMAQTLYKYRGLRRDPEEDKEVVGLQRWERRSWRRLLQTLRTNTQVLSGDVFNSSGLSATSSTPAVSGNLHKYLLNTLGFPGGAVLKKLPANAWDARDAGLIRVEKIPWSRKWQPTPVFLPGKFEGQRSLASWVGLDWAHTHVHSFASSTKTLACSW